MKINVISLDVGVLLTADDDYDEYEIYSQIYDREYGYYDEYIRGYQEKDLEEAIQYAREYVADGVDMTYAIITNQGKINYANKFDENDIEGFTYNAEDVIFSVAKIYGIIVEDFVKGE